MPSFIEGLRELLGLGNKPQPPAPHPLEPAIKQELAATEAAIDAASAAAESAKIKSLHDTLAVLRLQFRQAVGIYNVSADDKKATASSVLEKLQGKIAGVKEEAKKLGDEAVGEKKKWESQAGAYKEAVKKVSEMIQSAPSEAGPLGEGLVAAEKAADEKRYATANEQLAGVLSKIGDAYDKAVTKFDSTAEIEGLYNKYLSRSPVKSDDPYADIDLRKEELLAIEAAIDLWEEQHAGLTRESAQQGAKTLEGVRGNVVTAQKTADKEREQIRKGIQAQMLEQIKGADATERQRLSQDGAFITKLEANLPPKALDYARQQLGMSEIDLEIESFLKNIEPEDGYKILWDEKSILGADFQEYLKFETDKIEKVGDPAVKRQIVIPGGVLWKDELTGNMVGWDDATKVDVVGEGPDGEIRFVRASGKFGLIKKRVVLPKNDPSDETTRVTLKEVVYHKRENTPLFPETPSKAHVVQGKIGDCYLLAAVTSLVAKDPGAIEDMMNDKGGTVTVRLFDVSEKDGKKEFKARYFNVEKSVARDRGGNAEFADKFIWVQMLEKAYAAGNFTGKVAKATLAKYENIADGYISVAFEVLTGRPAEIIGYTVKDEREVAVVDANATHYTSYSLPWSTKEKGHYKGLTTPVDDMRQMTAWGIFSGSKTLVHQWMIYVQTGKIDLLLDREYKDDYSGELTIPDFVDLFAGKIKQPDGSETKVPKLDTKLVGPVLSWIRSNQLYPGKRGTAEYSKLQLSMFDGIKDGLDKGRMVGLGSKKKVARETTGIGHSGGEAIGGGLVGSHAYTVLKVREDGGLRSLLIRNPWGGTVQRNVTVADRLLEIDATPEIQEYTANAARLQELADDHKEKDKLLKAATAENQKVPIQAQIDTILDEHSRLSGEQTKIESGKLFKERTVLKKKDSTDLIPIQAEQSSDAGLEGGEFWLPLADLTMRFSNYHIC